MMKTKTIIHVSCWTLVLGLAIVCMQCAEPDTTGSDDVRQTGTVLRILSIESSDPCVSLGTTADSAQIDVEILNDLIGLGVDQRTAVTLTDLEVWISGTPYLFRRNEVLYPGASMTWSIMFGGPVASGNYPMLFTVEGINDYGKEVTAEAKYTLCVL